MTKRRHLARWVAAIELPFVAAIAPALLMPTPRRLLVLAAVPLIWLAAQQSGRGWVARTPFNLALWLMLGMVGISAYATADILFSLGKIAGVILGTLVFWALCRWLTTPQRLQLGAAAFVLAGVALAVIGLLGVEHPRKFAALSALGALLPRIISGIPGAEHGFNPNGVSGGLLLLIPLQVAGLLRARVSLGRRLVVVQSGLLLITAGTVVLMQSRTAWVSLLIGMAVLIAALPQWRRRLPALALAVLTVIAAAVGVATSDSGPTDEPSGAAVSVAQRTELWVRGIDAIRDSPITGTGMNMFRRLVADRYPVFLLPGTDVAHAHNHLLQAALDLGVPGLVAYLAVWLIAGTLLLRVLRHAQDPGDQAIAAGLAGGLAAYFAFGLADTIALGSKVGLLFWVALALVAALHRLAGPRADPAMTLP